MKKKIIATVLGLTVITNVFAQRLNLSQVENFSTSYSSSSSDESFTSQLFELIVGLLFLENLTVFYADYPGQQDFFIEHFSSSQEAAPEYHPWRFTAETGLFSYPGQNIIGNQSRLEGTAWHFIGPVIENSVTGIYGDDDYFDLKQDVNGDFRLGVQVFMLQTNIFSASWFIQWCHLYGSQIKDGVAFGIITKSHMLQKILLEWRMSFLSLQTGKYESIATESKSGGFVESHLEAGIMVSGPVELYGAWKWLEDQENYKTSNGVSFGVKYHF